MSYLVDTCVLSECVKKTPNPQVAQWLNEQNAECLFLSAITIAELKKGIYKLQFSQSERAQKLQYWLQTVEAKFYLRVLPITDDVLTRWASISAHAECQGKTLAVMDSLIAATALQHDLVLVTRNVDDFAPTGVRILNPWQTP